MRASHDFAAARTSLGFSCGAAKLFPNDANNKMQRLLRKSIRFNPVIKKRVTFIFVRVDYLGIAIGGCFGNVILGSFT